MDTPFLRVDNVSKHFGDIRAVQDVSFQIAEAEIVTLLGPSGCGKTTLLRCIAGLEIPDSGHIYLHGVDVSAIPAYKRGFGMMFQNFALFPHMNVFDNVAYGLRNEKKPAAEIAQRVDAMLALVDLQGYEKRAVDQLSGGQQQRVALARTLAVEPELVLLDEPLGSLDRALRERLMIDLRAILKKVGVTAVYVTHDQAEAYAVSDRMALMRNGRIVQLDTPRHVYRRPQNRFVAHFLGFANVVEGRWTEDGNINTAFGTLAVNTAPATAGQPVELLIRPAALITNPTEDDPNVFSARVAAVSFRGRYTELHLDIGDVRLEFEVDDYPEVPVDAACTIALDPDQIVIL